jgi:hypothetical protein
VDADAAVKEHVRLMMPPVVDEEEGVSVLNVGYGLGIVSDEFRSLLRCNLPAFPLLARAVISSYHLYLSHVCSSSL